MNLLDKIFHYGMIESVRKSQIIFKRKSGWNAWRYKNTSKFVNPSEDELESIERDLLSLGVRIESYTPPASSFKKFKADRWFPDDYHGGKQGGVWDEKLLEHWISSERLGLREYGSEKDIYVDVAAASSPWAQILRERRGVLAYAIDLCAVDKVYRHLPYYRIENATKTTFDDRSIKGVSLHCAYEMFIGEDDTKFIHEAARILRPNGKVVILPLYMHTHYCAYSTSEYFGKGYSDRGAKEYVRLDCNGVPSSRKYDAKTFKKRVLDTITGLGMEYNLLVLRNKSDLGDNIYCHFILEITR